MAEKPPSGERLSSESTRGAGSATNSVRPARRRLREVSAAPPESEQSRKKRSAGEGGRPPAASSGQPERLIPEHVRKRFVQVGHRYYFADGAHAFTDRGARLVTPSENSEVARSLIEIAQARGWGEITVTGSERFRKEAWAAASAAGLKVRGYSPTEFERAHLVRKLARGAAPSGGLEEPAASSSERNAARRGASDRSGFVAGRLIDHGAAPYRHDPHERISYFVKIETQDGERVIWGVDLQRALKESLTQPKIGDEVGLRAVRRDSVTVQQAKRDPAGNVVGQEPLDTHRNHWIVEKREFFLERAAAARTLRDPGIDPKQAARRHPELVGTYLQMRAAELAAQELRDPEDRQRFVSRVRAALADAVARGEPLPPVRLRERARTPTPAAGSVRGEEAPAR